METHYWPSVKPCKRGSLRKAEQCVLAVPDVLAPEDSNCSWEELSKRKENWNASNTPSLLPEQLPVSCINYLTFATDCHFQEIFRFLETPTSCQHKLHLLFKCHEISRTFRGFWYPCLITVCERNGGSWGSATFVPGLVFDMNCIARKLEDL
jgi:hypothetical protein